MQLVVLQHERYTCTRSLTFVFAAKLICANRPLRPFKLLFDGVYALRAVTSKSNRNSNGAPSAEITEALPTFAYRIPLGDAVSGP